MMNEQHPLTERDTSHDHQHHIATEMFYFQIFGLLLILLALTIAVAYVDLGVVSTLIAMTIAIVKGLVVILFFMHVKHGTRLTWVFSGAAFFWLIILIGLTMSDYISRDWIQPSEGWEHRDVVQPLGQEPAQPAQPAPSHGAAEH